jgi:hypothetical protein
MARIASRRNDSGQVYGLNSSGPCIEPIWTRVPARRAQSPSHRSLEHPILNGCSGDLATDPAQQQCEEAIIQFDTQHSVATCHSLPNSSSRRAFVACEAAGLSWRFVHPRHAVSFFQVAVAHPCSMYDILLIVQRNVCDNWKMQCLANRRSLRKSDG